MAKKSNSQVWAIVSAMGVLLTILTSLITGLRKRKVTEAMVYELGTPEGVPLLEKIMDAAAGILIPIVEAPKQAAKAVVNFITMTATVACDFDKGLAAVVELVRLALGLTYIHPDIFKFEWSRKELFNAEMALFHFGRDISTANAEEGMDDVGYRPATIAELLFFALLHPGLFLEYPLVALGSVRVGCSPFLGDWYGRRRLGLSHRVGGWHAFCRFLAVRKS